MWRSCEEGYCSYPGRSARNALMRDRRKVPKGVSRVERQRLSLQKSALPIVPEEHGKAM